MGKEIVTQVQEVHRVPYKINPCPEGLRVAPITRGSVGGRLEAEPMGTISRACLTWKNLPEGEEMAEKSAEGP